MYYLSYIISETKRRNTYLHGKGREASASCFQEERAVGEPAGGPAAVWCKSNARWQDARGFSRPGSPGTMNNVVQSVLHMRL